MMDPLTGDKLTSGEVASRLIQRIIRRWVFLLTITTITILIWFLIDPIWNHPASDIWNFVLSWLAIAIESVVGMFFFGQSMRDAVIIRKIEHMEEEHNKALQEIRDLLRKEAP